MEKKFRVWKKTEKKMFYTSFAIGQNGCIQFFEGSDTMDKPSDFLGPKFVDVMQYIGHKDRTGKDVFEKDIVSLKDSKGEIYGYKVVELKEIDDGGGTLGWGYPDVSHREVVGNIHDNPELLDGHTSKDVLERLKGV